MSDTTDINSTFPASGDNSPSNLGNQSSDTQQSRAYSPDFHKKITKALFPYSPKDEAVETTLNDSHGFLLDSLVCQAELLRDLGSKISGNEDIEGRGLAGFADNICRQLNILAVIQGEYHTQVEKDLDAMMRLIDTLKAENSALKGGTV